MYIFNFFPGYMQQQKIAFISTLLSSTFYIYDYDYDSDVDDYDDYDCDDNDEDDDDGRDYEQRKRNSLYHL